MTPISHSVLRRVLSALVILSAVVLTADPGVAVAQSDTRQLMDRIERLERDIRLLNVQLARGQGAAPAGSSAAMPSMSGDPSSYTRLEERLNTLEEEMRSMTGLSERLNHSLDEMTRRLDKFGADVDYRLGSVEKTGPGASNTASAPAAPTSTEASAPPPSRPGQPQTLGTLTESDLRRLRPGTASAATPPAAAPGAPPPTAEAQARALLPEGTVAERYNYAFGLLRQARYDQAEQALRAFLQAHGNDRLSTNARYWLGETYYVRGNYQVASQVFLENYQAAPKGEKAADSLLKLGMALNLLERKREACVTFDKLSQEFPTSPDNIKRAIAAERQRASCG